MDIEYKITQGPRVEVGKIDFEIIGEITKKSEGKTHKKLKSFLIHEHTKIFSATYFSLMDFQEDLKPISDYYDSFGFHDVSVSHILNRHESPLI